MLPKHLGGFAARNLSKHLKKMAPVANSGGAYAGSEGSDVPLDGAASFDPDGTIVSYAWDLDNDGQYDDAFGASVSFIANNEGLFPIGVQVTDDNGATSTAETSVTVANVAPMS